jgi:hypothetical protein
MSANRRAAMTLHPPENRSLQVSGATRRRGRGTLSDDMHAACASLARTLHGPGSGDAPARRAAERLRQAGAGGLRRRAAGPRIRHGDALPAASPVRPAAPSGAPQARSLLPVRHLRLQPGFPPGFLFSGVPALMGADNLCHQAIFVNHAFSAVAAKDAEVVKVGDWPLADQPPQSPQGWEHWFLQVTRKAIKADYLVNHDTPSAARSHRTHLVHATCHRSNQPPGRRETP